ncbi:ALG9 (YNL219C) [Zygosaccharomyces parabailii]|nr:ALG9 (YNL219C) [Zygosaccharomyces parabailii]CDH13412.1 probable Alpha-1,2-mannosyltransferase ALG9 [Zygosaccharomyces bailii ISA1307]
MSAKIATLTLVLLLALSRLWVQPVYSVIADCDETFNYWEPLNMMLRGFGKQTWEYSPEYSIRSWAFLLPFFSVLYPLNKVTELDAYWNFYITRFVLGLISFVLEIGLHYELTQVMSMGTANIWLFFQLLNPGWFHASVELLPSSIAMLLSLGSIKYALRYFSNGNELPFVASISFTFVAGVLGWPFVFLLQIPCCLHYAFTHKLIDTIRTGFDSAAILTLIVSTVFAIDSIIYGKFSPVSWNIFWYNVINASAESGPNIFGTEPWYYYFMNLVLNFPLPVLLFTLVGLFHRRIWPLSLSLVTWLAVFVAQPHKEERFLYPIFALITLCASVGFEKIIRNLGCKKFLKMVVYLGTLSSVGLLAISRIAALVIHYNGPLKVYQELFKYQIPTNETKNVCTGREWYHFPNSFFLPDDHRLRFVPSGFDGLLPGDFLEGESFLSQVRNIPEGMNKRNEFDEGKLWPSAKCDYYVDISKPIDFFKDDFNPFWMPKEWDKISCFRIIDVEDSKIFGRSFYVPSCIAEQLEKIFPQHWPKIYSAEQLDYCIYGNVERFAELSKQKQPLKVF